MSATAPRLRVSADDLGTPEAAWLSSPRLLGAPQLTTGDLAAGTDPLVGARRVLVLAPHPDDEVLAVGGLLATLASEGWGVDVLAVTDGEGSHPRSRRVTPRGLAELRATERDLALARLGIARARVTRLGCPDSAVASVHDLPERIVDHLRHDRGVRVCLAPWVHDGHPDHDAVGRAAHVACAASGVELLEYPVWAWHWAQPDTALPWSRVRRFVLGAGAQAAKRAAIAAYRSQIEPLGPDEGDQAILAPPVLARFHRPFETLFLCPVDRS
jgi:LmbE family N-acetylglucosaminyl deacetylase